MNYLITNVAERSYFDNVLKIDYKPYFTSPNAKLIKSWQYVFIKKNLYTVVPG